MSEELYYIQHIGFNGNCLKWWRPEGHGYTMNLDEAWKVTKEQAESICRTRPDEDLAHPVSVIDLLATRHLNCEALWAHQRTAMLTERSPALRETERR